MRCLGAAPILLLAALHCHAQDQGRTFAILIGISKYRDRGVEWLKYADRDAESFAAHLRSARGGSLSNIELFVEEDVTRRRITDTLEKVLQQRAGGRDTVYVFISARGFASADSEEGFISTFESPDEKQLQYTLRVSELRKHLGATNAGKVFLFADVCRESERQADNRINFKLEQLAKLQKPIAGLLATHARNPSREIEALEGGHGVFSFFLVNGLQARSAFQGTTADADKDGRVTFPEIVNYLGKQMQTGYKQTPSNFGDKNGRGIALSDLRERGIGALFPRLGQGVLLAWNGIGRSPIPSLLFYAGQTATESLDALFAQQLKAGNLLGPGGALEVLQRLRPSMLPKRWEDERDRLAAELEDRGEKVIARYGLGDRFPDDPIWSRTQLTAADFTLGERFFDAANQLRANFSLEARRLFCRGRALIFDPANMDAAKPVLESALRLDAAIPEAHNALGIVHLNKSNFSGAISYFKEAHKQAPRWAYPRVNLALAYSEQGNYLSAEREYREAIAATPYYPYLYINLAVLLQKLGRRKDAEKQYLRAVDVFDTQEKELRRRAAIWKDSKNASEEAEATAHADVLKRNVSEAYNGLGTIREAQKKDQEAVEFYRQALKANGDLIPARHNLASLYSKLSNTAVAIPLWQANLTQDEKFLPSRLGLARALLRNQRAPEAEIQYRAALKQSPTNFQAIEGLARSLMDQRRAPEARIVLEAAKRARQTPSPVLLEALGDVYLAQKDESRACAEFRAARDTLKNNSQVTKTLHQKLKACKV